MSSKYLSPPITWKIEKQNGYRLHQECRRGGKFGTIQLYRCTVRSIWLGNGFWSGIGSIFTGIIAGQALTHWWVEIETTANGINRFYILQWCGNGICLFPCKNRDEVTYLGKEAALGVKSTDSKNISNKYKWCTKDKYIADVYEWCERQNPNYDLLNNNCKHIAEKFYHKFRNIDFSPVPSLFDGKGPSYFNKN